MPAWGADFQIAAAEQTDNSQQPDNQDKDYNLLNAHNSTWFGLTRIHFKDMGAPDFVQVSQRKEFNIAGGEKYPCAFS